MRDNSGRRKTSIAGAIIACACIAVYLFALGSAAIRVYFSINQRKIAAAQEFSDIADLATSAGEVGFMDAPFIETIKAALSYGSTLEALIISGPDGEHAFERSKDKAIYWVNNSPRFKKQLDLSRQPFQRSLHIQGLRNVNIQGIAGTFNYPEINRILKETLVLIMAGLLLSFITLLIEILFGSSAKEPAAPLRRTASAEAGESSSGDEAVEEIAGEDEKQDEGPKGLYSPKTNIGWEEYTQERLQSELHRCASHEQDLVFMHVEIKALQSHPGFLAAQAIEFFSERDLIFEKGGDGVCVIYPNHDIAESLEKAKEFYNRVVGQAAEKNLYIGMSSRSGRIVDAARLMFEAEQAVRRAEADPDSPIIGFKSDPDKYRTFIAERTRNLP